MKAKWFFYLIIISLLFVGCTPKEKELPKENELSGQVFIVTKGGQNIKLGLVEISVIDYDKMNTFAQSRLQSAKQEIERMKHDIKKAQREYEDKKKAKDKFYRVYLDNIYSRRYIKEYRELEEALSRKKSVLNRLLTAYSGYPKATYFLLGLPKPIQSTETDADGKFSFKLKPGKYAIVAFSSIKVGGSNKDYYWFIWVNVKDVSQQRIILTNDNLLESEGESCIFIISQLLN